MNTQDDCAPIQSHSASLWPQLDLLTASDAVTELQLSIYAMVLSKLHANVAEGIAQLILPLVREFFWQSDMHFGRAGNGATRARASFWDNMTRLFFSAATSTSTPPTILTHEYALLADGLSDPNQFIIWAAMSVTSSVADEPRIMATDLLRRSSQYLAQVLSRDSNMTPEGVLCLGSTLVAVDALVEKELDVLLSEFLSALVVDIASAAVPDVVGPVLYEFGRHLYRLGLPATIAFLESAASVAQECSDPALLPGILTDLGGAFNDIVSDRARGLKTSLMAIDAAESRNVEVDTHALFNVGQILLILRRRSEAESYIRRALDQARHRNEAQEVVHSLRALAQLAKARGLFLEAERTYGEAIALGMLEKEFDPTSRALSELAELVCNGGNHQEAMRLYHHAAAMAQRASEAAFMHTCLNAEARVRELEEKGIDQFWIVRDGSWVLQDFKATSNPMYSLLFDEPDFDLASKWRAYDLATDVGDLLRRCWDVQAEIERLVASGNDVTECERQVELARSLLTLARKHSNFVAAGLNAKLIGMSYRRLRQLLPRVAGQSKLNCLYSLAVGALLARETGDQSKVTDNGGPTEPSSDMTESVEFGARNNPLHLSIVDIILEAIRLAAMGEGYLPVSDLELLVQSLPVSEALNLLDKTLAERELNTWSHRLILVLDTNCSSNEILPRTQSLLGDQTGLSTMQQAQLHRLEGERHAYLGQVREAEESFEKALQLCAQGGSELDRLTASIIVSKGQFLRMNGNYRSALGCYDSAIRLFDSSKSTAVNAWLSLAHLKFDMLEYAEARDCFVKCLDWYLADQNLAKLAHIYSGLANIASVAEDDLLEAQYRKLSINVAFVSGNVAEFASSVVHMGTYCLRQKQFDKALKWLHIGLESYQRLGRVDEVVRVKRLLGHWHASRDNADGHIEKATALWIEGIAEAARLGLPGEGAHMLFSLAQVRRGDPPEALRYLDQCLDLAWTIRYWRLSVEALSEKAMLLLRQEQPYESFQTQMLAVNTLDAAVAAHLNPGDFLAYISATYSDVCESAATAAFVAGLDDEIFRLSERSRSKLLREQIRGRQANEVALVDRTERQPGAEQEFPRHRGMSVCTNHCTTDSDTAKEAERDPWVLAKSGNSHGQTQPKNGPTTLLPTGSSEEARVVAANLSLDSYLVEFLFPAQFDFGLMMVLNRDTGLRVVRTPIGTTALERARALLTREVAEYPRYGDIGETWFDELETISAALASKVPPASKVLFVPHREMHHLPLHALPVGGMRLVERNPVTYLPTAALLERTWMPAKSLPSLLVGSVFEDEAQELAKSLGAETLLGSDASEEAVREALRTHRSIHFSCHGVYDAKYPLLSGLRLSHDDVLTADAVMQMSVATELVVLSACQTGQATIRPGDNLEGLTQAFLVAGARTVISTQWSVNPQATSELMMRLYKHMLDNHSSATEALRAAQVSFMSDEVWKHPYYWAGFIANGTG